LGDSSHPNQKFLTKLGGSTQGGEKDDQGYILVGKTDLLEKENKGEEKEEIVCVCPFLKSQKEAASGRWGELRGHGRV